MILTTVGMIYSSPNTSDTSICCDVWHGFIQLCQRVLRDICAALIQNYKRVSSCNYGNNTTNSKNPNITPNNFCIYHSPVALCFFFCYAEFKDCTLNCLYCIRIISHLTLKTPCGQKPHFNHLFGKYETRRTKLWIPN